MNNVESIHGGNSGDSNQPVQPECVNKVGDIVSPPLRVHIHVTESLKLKNNGCEYQTHNYHISKQQPLSRALRISNG